MRRWIALLPIALVAVAAAADSPDAQPDPRLAKSRELIKQFMTELQAELNSSMKAGGPENSIDVCRGVAPAIVARLSRQNGVKMGRTSRRFRNPNNMPADWQMPVLARFETRLAEGADPGEVEYHAQPDTGPAAFRYMKAIPMRGQCLGCHGEKLAPSVEKRLQKHYPHDRARGFEPGDLRGAFYVVWPQERLAGEG